MRSFVKVYDGGHDVLIDTICGHRTNYTVRTASQRALVYFYTDGIAANRGFSMHYTMDEPVGESGRIAVEIFVVIFFWFRRMWWSSPEWTIF